MKVLKIDCRTKDIFDTVLGLLQDALRLERWTVKSDNRRFLYVEEDESGNLGIGWDINKQYYDEQKATRTLDLGKHL